MQLSLAFATLLQFAASALSISVPNEPVAPTTILNSPPVNTVIVDGITFEYLGMVGVGDIDACLRDPSGATIGGIGSAIAIKRGTWRKCLLEPSKYCATIVVQPDRGFNIITTVDYESRHFEFEMVFEPYIDLQPLSIEAALETIELTLSSTVKHVDEFWVPTTGLDALAVRQQYLGSFELSPEPALPIPSLQYNRISVDAEGIVLNPDGTIFISDEYGPYVYHFDGSGRLINTLVPPKAILPYINGTLNFTSVTDPDTGRAGNQGFEGLAMKYDGSTLYAALQSATMQDGGDSKKHENCSRVLEWNLNTKSGVPELVSEKVLGLPLIDGETKPLSEAYSVVNNVIAALCRDGDGDGNYPPSTTNSTMKGVYLCDLSEATNILGSEFDEPENPVCDKGILNSTVTAANCSLFVDFLDGYQLGRFSMVNYTTLTSSEVQENGTVRGIIDKVESLAFAPVMDPAYPTDYLLFDLADNDFQCKSGWLNGKPFSAEYNIPSRMYAHRVRMGIPPGTVEQFLGISYNAGWSNPWVEESL